MTDSKQRFGLSYDELATRQTVYRENLLDDHSVLITGAGSGMGKAMAWLFARLGADVPVWGRQEEKSMNDQLCILDIETTGFEPEDSEILELYILKVAVAGTLEKIFLILAK